MTDVDCVAPIRALEAQRRFAMRTADAEALRAPWQTVTRPPG